MTKKYLTLLCLTFFALTACASRTGDAAGRPPVEERQETEQSLEAVQPPEMGQESEAAQEPGTGQYPEAAQEQESEPQTETAQVPEKEEDIRAQALYETFVNAEYAGVEGYAYVIYDADGDGCKELYIQRNNPQRFYSLIYAEGGLCIERRETLPPGANMLQWTDTEALTAAGQEEWEHSGLYVSVRRENRQAQYWYANEADFAAGNGFGGAEPFFEYSVPDGGRRLTLYYDEAAQRGCGIRYYERDPSTFTTTGMYGFVFESVQEREGSEEEKGGSWEAYLDPVSVDGTNGAESVENFQENTEYDAAGRIVHYDASGVVTFLKDNQEEADPLLWIDYEYYGNGGLKSRFYWHNGYVFGTWYTTWNCYFDRQGRLAYEDIYVTHGSWDTYYIYTGDGKAPAYILDLDNCMGEWIPAFRKGNG